MPVSRTLLYSQIVGNVIGIILSIFIIAPLCISLFKFKFHCLLFSYGVWRLYPSGVKWASPGYCCFVIGVGAVMLILCCMQIYRLLKCLFNGTDLFCITPVLETVMYAVMTCLMMYAALVVTLGFMTWCDFIKLRYRTCEEGDSEKIDGLYTEDYFFDFVTVEIVVWLAFAICVTFTGYSLFKLYRINTPRNDPVSPPNERQPLLNSTRSEPVTSDSN